ncbi:unnamed protein product, partial [Allacma fusca]
KRIRSGVYSVV